MPTANEILAERIDRIENLPSRFVNLVGASQQEYYNELMVILSRLGLDDGTLVLNQANILRVEALMQEYYEVLRDGKYGSQVAGYMVEFDRQKALSDEYNDIEFGGLTSQSANLVFQNGKRRSVELLLGDDFKTNFINIVRDEVISNVEARATFTELRTNLLELFTETERLPVMQNWVSQISSDIFAITDRSYNKEIATDLELEFGQYAGGLIKDSRAFCVERDGKFFHLKEVESWASLTWQGRYRRTNEQNIVDWLGGYNCKHVFAFRSLASVPQSVIERNIESGNFTPTAIERELLGLS